MGMVFIGILQGWLDEHVLRAVRSRYSLKDHQRHCGLTCERAVITFHMLRLNK